MSTPLSKITGLTFIIILALIIASDSLADEPAKVITVVQPAEKSVIEFGAKGDGATDDTAAIQNALNETAKTGGLLRLPPGKYLVRGSLTIPPAVTLQGDQQSPIWSDPPLIGSVILTTAGRDNEDAPALFELDNSAAVRGIVVFYPEQKSDDIHPYSWTFHLKGIDNTVENITLINSYNAIRVGPEGNARHRIRSVYGCALRRGIFINNCTDIGRIENIQFHCHWWSLPATNGKWEPVHKFMRENLEAFIFGRTDWEYVNNTFVYPVNIGYKFIQTPAGAANGQFCGIGADEAQICVKVEAIQYMGLLITNGQFVCMHGDTRTNILIDKTCNGSVRLVNCAFWGPNKQNVVSHSNSFVSLSDCFFSGDDRTKNPGLALVEADSGKLQVRGCSFDTDQTAIALKKGLQHAIITENNAKQNLEILNEIPNAAIQNNQSEK